MRLKFIKIHMNNFMSFKNEIVRFEDLGYTVVTGINKRAVDGANSNGAGKSTVFNALCFALTGETISGLSNNVENIYADPNDCWVELEFTVDNDRFIIRRIKTPRSDLKIYINGVDASGKGIKESTKLLNDYLPDLTSMLLSNIIILGQGLPNKFTDGGPGHRKYKLEQLTKSDYLIQAIRSKLDDRMSNLRSKLRYYEDSKIAVITELSITTKSLEDLSNELNSFNNSDLTIHYDECVSELQTLKNKLIEYSNELETTNNTIDNLRDSRSTICTEYQQLIKNINNVSRASLNSFVNDRAEILSKVRLLEKDIDTYYNMTDVCPTCGQKLPDSMRVDISIFDTELKREKERLSQVEQSMKSTNDAIKKEVDFLYEEQAKKLSDIDDNIKSLKSICNNIDTNIKSVNSSINKLEINISKIAYMKENMCKLQDNISSLNDRVSELNDKNRELELNIVDMNDHIRVIQTMITLTKKEFRGILLENIIKFMNSKVKEYSKQVFNTDLLSFELNENSIDIRYDNKYYEALSGGEKQKVDIIIQLSIRDLLSTQLNIHSNILVLDEALDFLDSSGSSKIIELVSNLKDVESVFFISHHSSELGVSYDSHLDVVKGEDGISKVYIR